jgi:hypothetical protein
VFGLKKKNGPPPQPFQHASTCPIVRSDPGYEPPWQEIDRGNWKRECRCTAEYWHEVPADAHVQIDPFDPSTSRHLGQCEHRDTEDPAVLRMLLRVKDGMGDGYWWVECGSCESAWQVPHYAAERDG